MDPTDVLIVPQHYVPKINLFLGIIHVIYLSVMAYISFKYRKDQHLILQVKDVSKVPINLFYALLIYSYRNRWNGGGWPMTIISLIIFSIGSTLINRLLDTVLTAELQKKYFGEKDK